MGKTIVLRLLAVLVLLCAGLVEANVLVNSGFEQGTTGWVPMSGSLLTASAAAAHTGGFSGYSSGRTATWQGPRQDLAGVMVPGVAYTMSVWVRLDAAVTDTVRLTVKKADGSGTLYSTVASASAGAGQWIQLVGSYTLTVNGTISSLYMYVEGPAAGVSYFVDDAVAEPPAAPAPSVPKATVDVQDVRQQVRGFGAAGAYYVNWLYSHPSRAALVKLMFADLGLDIFRARNTYGVSADFDRDCLQLGELLAQGRSLGGAPMQMMLSSWSPPAALKSNGDTALGGTLARDAVGAYRYGDFGSWWAQSLAAYAARGLSFSYINIQNEPDYTADYDSCRFAPTETADMAGYDKALTAVRAALQAAGVPKPALLGPETLSLARSAQFLDVLIPQGLVDGVAHHLYGDGSFDSPDAMVPAMRTYSATYGSLPIFQTEYARLAGGDGFRGAMNLARHIHNCMAEESAAAYVHWGLFWAKNTDGTEGSALVLLDNPWGTAPSYTITPKYYAFKQFSAFISEGWTRVGAASQAAGVRVSAFKSPGATNVTVVLVNDSTAAVVGYELSFSGFTPVGGRVFRTTATESCADVGAFTPGQTLDLPAESIVTLQLSAGGGVPPSSEPPPATITQTTMKVVSIVMGTYSAGKRKGGQARVSVVDQDGKAVSGAQVSGTFSGSFSGTASALTDSAGVATVKTATTSTAKRLSFSFAVTGVTKTNCLYSASASTVTSAKY